MQVSLTNNKTATFEEGVGEKYIFILSIVCGQWFIPNTNYLLKMASTSNFFFIIHLSILHTDTFEHFYYFPLHQILNTNDTRDFRLIIEMMYF